MALRAITCRALNEMHVRKAKFATMVDANTFYQRVKHDGARAKKPFKGRDHRFWVYYTYHPQATLPLYEPDDGPYIQPRGGCKDSRKLHEQACRESAALKRTIWTHHMGAHGKAVPNVG